MPARRRRWSCTGTTSGRPAAHRATRAAPPTIRPIRPSICSGPAGIAGQYRPPAARRARPVRPTACVPVSTIRVSMKNGLRSSKRISLLAILPVPRVFTGIHSGTRTRRWSITFQNRSQVPYHPASQNPVRPDRRCTRPSSAWSVYSAVARPLAVCASAGSVHVDSSVQADAGFSDPVMLSLTDAPPGATSSFSTNPVVPPGSSLLTFGSLGNATAGDFVVTLTGTSADEAADKALPFTLNDIAPDSVDLLTPADGAGASRQPQLEWSTPTSQGATDFLVEIATDPGFGDIVYSDIVIGEASTIVSAPLESSTEYFWKVTPSNACGTAATSQTFSFITQAAPGDCAPGSAEIVHFTDDIEAGDNGWTHSSIVGPDTWVRQTTDANSPVTAWQSDDVAVISDQRLVSPTIALPETANLLTLQYYAQRGLEDGGAGCFDGGILEYSSDGGQNWSQVGAARLLTNPYTGPIDDGFENPLIGSDAWCGNQGWTRTVVDLAGLEGLDIQFRYRLGTDSSVEADSWRIDDVSVKSCGLEMIFSNGFESPIQVRR